MSEKSRPSGSGGAGRFFLRGRRSLTGFFRAIASRIAGSTSCENDGLSGGGAGMLVHSYRSAQVADERLGRQFGMFGKFRKPRVASQIVHTALGIARRHKRELIGAFKYDSRRAIQGARKT